MTWITDWATGVSETISEIQSLDSKISVLVDSNTTTLPSVPASTLNGNFWSILAYGVSSATATTLTLYANGVAIASAPIGNSQVFIFEADLFYDDSNGNIPCQSFAPAGGSYSPTQLSGSPTNITFSLGGTASVDSFWLKPR
jgi:hypothetical protein